MSREVGRKLGPVRPNIPALTVVAIVTSLIVGLMWVVATLSGWLTETSDELEQLQTTSDWIVDAQRAADEVLLVSQRSALTMSPAIALPAPARDLELKVRHLRSKFARVLDGDELALVQDQLDVIEARTTDLLDAADATVDTASGPEEEGIDVDQLLLLEDRYRDLTAELETLSNIVAGIQKGAVTEAATRSTGAARVVYLVGPLGILAIALLLIISSRTMKAMRLIRQELEEEKSLLETVLNTVPSKLWWLDQNLQPEGSNKSADLAIDRGAEATGIESEVLSTGLPIHNRQYSATAGDGRRTLLQSSVPLVDNDEVHGVLTIVSDITTMVELQAQLDQTSRLESIGQLAAGVAHEINTPIQFVSDNTGFLQSSFADLMSLFDLLELEDDTHRAYLNRAVLDAVDYDYLTAEIPNAFSDMAEGLDRVTEIVRSMKSFSHMDDSVAAADLNEAIRSTVTVSRNEWKYVAELELELDHDLGLVDIRQGPVKQAILNMIVNAAHAIEARQNQDGQGDDRSGDGAGPGATVQGRITITTKGHNDHVTVAITDNGTGISDGDISKIFEPFFTTKEVGRGTGQGLGLAHKVIADGHGGHIGVESELGVGTTFTLTIPRTQADGDTAGPTTSPQSDTITPGPPEAASVAAAAMTTPGQSM